MQTMKTLAIETRNPLEAFVRAWINERASEYETGVRGVLEDLAHGGCSSGYVSDLIYTEDGAAFYKAHAATIDAMAHQAFEDSGEGPAVLFERAGWDTSDPFAREPANQCLLAWFGFEEAARELGERAGIEL